MNKTHIIPTSSYQCMTKPGFVRELVINGYLNGKSFDEISNENNIAKGSVFNIINTWIAQIGIPDIEEIREFSIVIRKSGITIKQCAQSFRFIQILARFGITDELDSTYFSDIIQRNRGKTKMILQSRIRKIVDGKKIRLQLRKMIFTIL